MNNRIQYFLITAALTATAANASLISADNGQLLDDSVDNITWAANAGLFQTLATQSGNATAFVQTIVGDSNGQATSADFSLINGGNASAFTMDWNGAKAFINYLNTTSYLGYSTWRLPTTVNAGASSSDTPATTSSEMAELFYGQLGTQSGVSITDPSGHNSNYSLFTGFVSANQNDGRNYFWSGTAASAGAAWDFKTWENSQDFDPTSGFFNVLPVMSGQVPVSTAPEPGALWMIVGGTAALAGLRTRRRGVDTRS